MLGFGLGLRTAHYTTILETLPPIDWFEIISENYMVAGGKPLYFLDKIREHYPIDTHGVSLSIGSSDPLNWDYLKQLKTLISRIRPVWVSDHLCWTGTNGLNMHDLLPLSYTEETLNHVVKRVKEVQDYLERKILLENVSSYVSFKESTFTEWDFISAVANEANCLILLDINNIYVSAFNHAFDPHAYLNAIPIERVQQFHLAGHTNNTDHIIDTHDANIIESVWELYKAAVKRFGNVATMIERDDNIPPLQELLIELDYAKKISHNRLNHIIEKTA
jgi:uncharacterized protein (UPF0276 family)